MGEQETEPEPAPEPESNELSPAPDEPDKPNRIEPDWLAPWRKKVEQALPHAQRNNRGMRMMGWEDVNGEKLTEILGYSDPNHLRAVLTGRKNGSGMFIKKVAAALKISVSDLWRRIELASKIRQEWDKRELTPKQERVKAGMIERGRRLAARAQSARAAEASIDIDKDKG